VTLQSESGASGTVISHRPAEQSTAPHYQLPDSVDVAFTEDSRAGPNPGRKGNQEGVVGGMPDVDPLRRTASSRPARLPLRSTTRRLPFGAKQSDDRARSTAARVASCTGGGQLEAGPVTGAPNARQSRALGSRSQRNDSSALEPIRDKVTGLPEGGDRSLSVSDQQSTVPW
jgi:hypothetical protein